MHDVDGADVDNELAAVEYIDELYKYYKFAEVNNHEINNV